LPVADRWRTCPGQPGSRRSGSFEELIRSLAKIDDLWESGVATVMTTPGKTCAKMTASINTHGQRGSDMNTAIGPRGAANPKLPLWDTICLAYSTYVHFFSDVLRITWLWLVLCGLLSGIASIRQWSWMAELIAQRGLTPQTLTTMSRPIDMVVLGTVSGLALLLAGLSIAVAWHRRIVLGEHPGVCGNNVATRSMWRYLLVGLAIALSLVPPMLLQIGVLVSVGLASRGATPGSFAPGPLLLLPFIFALYIAAVAVMLRLCPLLPARAVGDLDLSFKQTWRRTRGNTWRLFWGITACTLPLGLIAQIVMLSVVGFPGPNMFAGDAFVGRMAIISVIFAIYYLLFLPVMIGFMSISYRHFFPRA
jgi:hypothetical protein